MSDALHQVLYSWSETSLLGTRGMGPVGTTLPADLLARWDRLLREHVWAARSGVGFVHLTHEGIGVLIRKEPTTSADGREGSAARAILGPGLTARTALGLTVWDGWHAPDLDVLDWSDLGPASDGGLEVLRRRARTLSPAHVADLFARLLTAPGEKYTIVGEADPLALTCLLGDLIGQVPSFASHEPDDVRQNLPTAVFLKDTASYSPVVATRRRLDVGAPVHDPILLPFAEAMADAYAADGLDGIALATHGPPPADLDEARMWAANTQFAPGVLADLARLPTLSPGKLDRLAEPHALERIKNAARTAPTALLLPAMGCDLPHVVETALRREALDRVLANPSERDLLAGLAKFGPLPARMLAENPLVGLDDLARVSRMLTTRADRRMLLEHTAQNHTFGELIRWITRHANVDPDGARAVFSALCGRAKRATRDDVDELLTRRVLVDQIRLMVESEPQVSTRLVSLLGTLPRRFIGRPEVLERLLHEPDPALLHALETLPLGETALARVRETLRLAYYRDNHLPDPRPALADDLTSRMDPWWRILRRRRPPSDPGLPLEP
ncbi:hypothetical protein [Streptosporangium sp. LJ11]|uniref:hypothetical protein n=1 Tax=Streptosporangium sp. LJ11 TaxID=3436927 RepID=UPI003F79F89F